MSNQYSHRTIKELKAFIRKYNAHFRIMLTGKTKAQLINEIDVGMKKTITDELKQAHNELITKPTKKEKPKKAEPKKAEPKEEPEKKTKPKKEEPKKKEPKKAEPKKTSSKESLSIKLAQGKDITDDPAFKKMVDETRKKLTESKNFTKKDYDDFISILRQGSKKLATQMNTLYGTIEQMPIEVIQAVQMQAQMTGNKILSDKLKKHFFQKSEEPKKKPEPKKAGQKL